MSVLGERRGSGLRDNCHVLPIRLLLREVGIAARRIVLRMGEHHPLLRRADHLKTTSVLHLYARILGELDNRPFRHGERHAVGHHDPVAHHADDVVAPNLILC